MSNLAVSRPDPGQFVIEQVDSINNAGPDLLALPTALLRGDRDEQLGLDFRGYTLHERALLGVLLGIPTGFRYSNDGLARLAGDDLGRDTLAAIIEGLERRGHLRATLVGDEWRWQIRLHPQPVDGGGA